MRINLDIVNDVTYKHANFENGHPILNAKILCIVCWIIGEIVIV
jgi:hypothetical protein